MKNEADVFRGGTTDILTTNERGIYPAAPWLSTGASLRKKYWCRATLKIFRRAFSSITSQDRGACIKKSRVSYLIIHLSGVLLNVYTNIDLRDFISKHGYLHMNALTRIFSEILFLET